mmetsp:Transcript_21161/g.56413  ORF Transcript_21161/g.56413 Transcript_21161/m.56413 type:complete len:235 (+) Transcript_21161:968-1672(+)
MYQHRGAGSRCVRRTVVERCILLGFLFVICLSQGLFSVLLQLSDCSTTLSHLLLSKRHHAVEYPRPEGLRETRGRQLLRNIFQHRGTLLRLGPLFHEALVQGHHLKLVLGARHVTKAAQQVGVTLKYPSWLHQPCRHEVTMAREDHDLQLVPPSEALHFPCQQLGSWAVHERGELLQEKRRTRPQIKSRTALSLIQEACHLRTCLFSTTQRPERSHGNVEIKLRCSTKLSRSGK